MVTLQKKKHPNAIVVEVFGLVVLVKMKLSALNVMFLLRVDGVVKFMMAIFSAQIVIIRSER